MKVYAAVLVVFAGFVNCSAQAPQSSDTALKLYHTDVTHMDTTVDPCENFWGYVCGKLNAENPIPPDQIWWGPAEQLEEWNRQVLREILEKNQAASGSRTGNEQKIGDFYEVCMSQADSGTSDIKYIQLLLDQIGAMKDKHEIGAVLARLHSSFGRVWEGGDNQTTVAIFGYGPTPDYNDVSRVVAGLDQGGLGMPSRDFYLKDDDNSKAIRGKYVTLVKSLLKLGGASDTDAGRDTDRILRLETSMAQAQMDNITRRDPNKLNNRFTLAQVKELVPAFDWDEYLRGVGAPTVPLYEVTSPDYFRSMNKLLVDEDLTVWEVYLRWQVLRAAADTLGNSWREASFAFDSALLGQKQQPPDWRRCARATDRYVGQALGQVYVAQVFPPASKARAQKMVKDIEAAMGRDIDAATWMQPGTKREAHLKLAAVGPGQAGRAPASSQTATTLASTTAAATRRSVMTPQGCASSCTTPAPPPRWRATRRCPASTRSPPSTTTILRSPTRMCSRGSARTRRPQPASRRGGQEPVPAVQSGLPCVAFRPSRNHRPRATGSACRRACRARNCLRSGRR